MCVYVFRNFTVNMYVFIHLVAPLFFYGTNDNNSSSKKKNLFKRSIESFRLSLRSSSLSLLSFAPRFPPLSPRFHEPKPLALIALARPNSACHWMPDIKTFSLSENIFCLIDRRGETRIAPQTCQDSLFGP